MKKFLGRTLTLTVHWSCFRNVATGRSVLAFSLEAPTGDTLPSHHTQSARRQATSALRRKADAVSSRAPQVSLVIVFGVSAVGFEGHTEGKMESLCHCFLLGVLSRLGGLCSCRVAVETALEEPFRHLASWQVGQVGKLARRLKEVANCVNKL